MAIQQIYDEHGMVKGNQYLDEHGMVTGNMQITAPKRSLVSNQMGAAPAASPMQQASPMGLSSLTQAIEKQNADNQARFSQVWDRVNGQQNPFDTNSQAFQGGLSRAINDTTRRMNSVQARTAGSLAPMAGGLRAALANNTGVQRAMALSDTQNRMYDEYGQRSAAFEADRSRSLAHLASGDYSGAIATYGTLAQLPGLVQSTQLANEGRALDNAYSQGTLGNRIEATGIQNEAARTQLRQYALSVGMDEQTFEAELANKKQQLEAARQQGREAAWMAQNSWWLGPLKFAVNVGASVATMGAYQGGAANAGPAGSPGTFSGYGTSGMA